MLLELLRNEDKYGLSEVSGMMGVCFQLLTCLSYESAYNDAVCINNHVSNNSNTNNSNDLNHNSNNNNNNSNSNSNKLKRSSSNKSNKSRPSSKSMVGVYKFDGYCLAVCDFALKRILAWTENDPVYADNTTLYILLSVLMTTCLHDKSCRRRITNSYVKIIEVFMMADSYFCLPSLLRLTLHLIDNLNKIDREAEEAVISLVVRGLRMVFTGDRDLVILTCHILIGALTCMRWLLLSTY